ncbi:MAG TPA: DUF4381 domain-containing protein [Dokdonella sp.]|uniref:DUF4381 domain-containing protein n=2 Tax=Dokdonella sp. TaxID=2291710 RepID=UPI002C8FF98C|nr:DUF4381 domain-containing protein [Dokdonella sp.]HOX70482.1 DUF4381 domain-containing protein [Dokdonella sp.]HPG95091.1 DUF4381 domain-containing protein [Dokdonella sp.]HPN79779.1 DUF4381 domain-containing protein [Dokdonella sp.]
MNAAGPTLRDIHMPPDPSWWPPAPGWWLLAILLVAATIYAAVHLRRRLRVRRWQRSVQAELERIAATHGAPEDAPSLAAAISGLLRRASRLLDAGAPSLRGEAWLAFLDSKMHGDGFSNGPGRVILDGPYRREIAIDAEALLDLTRRWLATALSRQVHRA